jgi:RNA polymerase II C-terminal domain phosphatase-like 3/4
VIKAVREEVLQGCKLVFSRVFPQNARPQDQFIWKMAEQLGAICHADLDSTVTHVVALDPRTDKALWANGNKKFLVHPRWIEAANFRWCRQPEDEFPVPPFNGKGKAKENVMANHHKETSKGKVNSVAGEKETGQDEENIVAYQEKAQKTALDTIATAPTDS